MASSLISSLFVSPLPSPKHSFLSPNPNPHPNPRRRTRPRLSKISASSSSSSFRNGSPRETECPVPPEQQPVNEFQALAASLPFSWASAGLGLYYSRLAVVGTSFALLIGLPVAAFGTGGHLADPRCALGAASAGILAVTLAVLRMYLGWAYVGNRLLSATVEYEETGWYDGQIWVKTPEVLARDRLLGSFSVLDILSMQLTSLYVVHDYIAPAWNHQVDVKPVLSRVKITLVGLAVSLAVCVLLFVNVENSRNSSEDIGRLAVAGEYNDASARSFEPDAFCGEPDLS